MDRAIPGHGVMLNVQERPMRADHPCTLGEVAARQESAGLDQNQEAGVAAIEEVDGAEVGVTETCCVTTPI